MKILFCKISWMKYYQGAGPDDQPQNGGAFVDENGYGHEELNFLPIEFDGESEPLCLGFVETKRNPAAQRSNALHLEKIDGCELLKKEPYIDDVLVVWCATQQKNEAKVVGWYHHATVCRHYQSWYLELEDGSEEERFYNIIAKASDCWLLPTAERNRFTWNAPTARKLGYGFGQALVWYATEPQAEGYIERLLKNIAEYEATNPAKL